MIIESSMMESSSKMMPYSFLRNDNKKYFYCFDKNNKKKKIMQKFQNYNNNINNNINNSNKNIMNLHHDRHHNDNNFKNIFLNNININNNDNNNDNIDCLHSRSIIYWNKHRSKLKFRKSFISSKLSNQIITIMIMFVMIIAINICQFSIQVNCGAINQQQTSSSSSHSYSISNISTGSSKKSGRRPPQRFEMEPIDKTAIVGDTIILPCRVANKVGTLQWTRDGFGLGTERSLEGFQRYRMIGSDDEGDYSLEISPVALEDDAVFQCQVGAVDGVLGIRSRSAKFTVQVPPEPPVIVVTHAHSHAQVYKSIDNGVADGDGSQTDSLSVSATDSNGHDGSNDHQLRTTAGMTIELTCEAHGGRPPAELTWMDSAGNPITNGVSYSTTKLNDGKRWNAALKWTVVASKALDGQRVTCRSENAALKSARYAHIQLEVRYAPEVELRIASIGDNNNNAGTGSNSDTGLVREGDDLTLECVAVGNPSRMTFKWSRDGVPLGTEGDVSASGGDGTPRLVFRHVGKEFHGTQIACEVANSVGTSRAKLDVKVAKKPRFIRVPEPVLGMSKTENIRLKCNVDSYPEAQITWSKFTPKLSLDANSPERFTDHWQEIGDGPEIQVSSAGRYRCLAKNAAFEDELKGETLVFIKGAPLIRSPSIQYGVENEPVRLQCIVEALPPPTRITWYKLKPSQHVLDVDNNEGYEILEEEDPDDYSMFQPPSSISGSSASSSSSMSTSSSTGMIDENSQQQHLLQQASSFPGYLALLRSVIFIRRAKDSDFAQYNCSVWNQYGFQSQIITLQKQSNILSPLVLTLSGIICFGVIFVLLSSLVVFICLRSQRMMSQEHSLTPKKMDSNNLDLHHQRNTTSCNGSVVMDGSNGTSDDYKINTLNSLEKNVLMKNTIMKMTGSNQVLTTVANGGNGSLLGAVSNDLIHAPYMNSNLHNHHHNNGGLPLYNEYDSYSPYQYPQTNNDLIIANGNAATTTNPAAYNYDNMTTYSSHYIPALNDYNNHHDNNVPSQQQPLEADKNTVSLSNYYHSEQPNNHLYSVVKKNNHNNNNNGCSNQQQHPLNDTTSNNNNSNNGNMINSTTAAAKYATLLSPGDTPQLSSPSTTTNNNNKLINGSNSHPIISSSTSSSNNEINNSHSYSNTTNYSTIVGQLRSNNKTDQFVNPYIRTSNTNNNIIHGSINGLSSSSTMNHYSNVVDNSVSNAATVATGDRLLSAGVYSTQHHHHHHANRYKTNSLGGGSSSSGVISTGGSSPGHSPVGSMSGTTVGPGTAALNVNGTHV